MYTLRPRAHTLKQMKVHFSPDIELTLLIFPSPARQSCSCSILEADLVLQTWSNHTEVLDAELQPV